MTFDNSKLSGYYEDQIYDWTKQWHFIQHTPFLILGTRESWMSQMLIHFGLQLLPKCSKFSASNEFLKSKSHSINLTFRKPWQSYYFTSFWRPNIYEEFDIWQLQTIRLLRWLNLWLNKTMVFRTTYSISNFGNKRVTNGRNANSFWIATAP